MNRFKMQMLGSLALLSLTACAAAQPSQQLVDARKVNADASQGRAAEYAPAELLEANNLLQQAETAKDGSQAEIQYAYLADRSARRAESQGTSLYLAKQASLTDERYNELQETGRLDAEASLDATRDELVEVKQQQKDGKAASKTALAASETARLSAEARAAAAIASLTSLANVREENNRTVITLSGSVLFQTGASQLIALAKDSLGRVAGALKELPPERRITIAGYTDSVGATETNQTLSQARAESVMAYLSGQGIGSDRMTAVGHGEDNPVATNDTADGRANNRRVELVIDK